MINPMNGETPPVLQRDDRSGVIAFINVLLHLIPHTVAAHLAALVYPEQQSPREIVHQLIQDQWQRHQTFAVVPARYRYTRPFAQPYDGISSTIRGICF